MKKLFSLILAAALVLSLCTTAGAAEERQVQLTYCGISIVADGAVLDTGENEPFIMDGRTYLPVRAVASALGLSVCWDGETSTITLTSGGEKAVGAEKPGYAGRTVDEAITYRGIRLVIDGAQAELGGAEPFIMNGYTYLPVRAVASALGFDARWDNDTKTVVLFSGGKTVRVTAAHARDAAGEDIISSETRTEHYFGEKIVFAESSGGAVEIYVYGADGRLESCTVNAPGSERDSYTLYYYGIDGRLARSDTYTGRTTTAVHSTRGSYTYDENGLLVHLCVHYPNASWDDTEYTRDEAGRLVLESTESYDILSQNHSYSRTEYFYGETGLLERSSTLGFETVYDYDGAGRLISSVKTRADGTFTVTGIEYFD